MSLNAGTRLGPYEILAARGAGGMGEVYRARDTKLNCDVALKIIPDTFAIDPDRVARFLREALVLASLNHPHIAAIYGFGTAVRPTRSSSNWSKARHSPIALRADRFRGTRRYRSFGRSVRRSKRPTSRGSSIAISSRRISRELMRVGIERSATWAATTPTKVLGPGHYYYGAGGYQMPTYDVSRDGQRFLMMKEVAARSRLQRHLRSSSCSTGSRN